MIQSNAVELERDLEAFSRRLEARIHEFKATGQLPSAHEELANEMRERQAQLRRKVSEAIASGTAWDVIRTEFTRDFQALFDSFARWERRLDADSAIGDKAGS
jgi:hypothetical protein